MDEFEVNKNVEYMVMRAIKKNCFIEVTSLEHNIIEFYLRKQLERNGVKLKSDIKMSFLIEKCKDEKLISKAMETDLINFNERRNKTMHELLKSDNEKIRIKNYSDLRNIARFGREIQLRLSPLEHSERDIKGILNFFDNPP